jgi:hypothetical protein
MRATIEGASELKVVDFILELSIRVADQIRRKYKLQTTIKLFWSDEDYLTLQ